MPSANMRSIEGSPFEYDVTLDDYLKNVADRVSSMREVGRLSPEVLEHLARLFRVKNIYHSNAIEGNQLDQGETRLVVEQGITITGKSLKDQAEAKNLNQALDFLVELARSDQAITQSDIRQIHRLILTNINDEEAGNYRSVEVRISGSNYVPTGPENVAPEMTDFADWVRSVTEGAPPADPILIASAAHAWFALIHPFVDGNGRTARILMDLLLMRRGYPIAIITKEDRPRYYDALEESQSSNLSPLISLVYESVEESLEAYEQAAQEQVKRKLWIADIAERLQAPERTRQTNEYELWSRAMHLLRELFRQITEGLATASNGMYQVHFRDFGSLDLEKYLMLRTGQSAKRTWFFRIDFVRSQTTARYLFFFVYGSDAMRDKAPVTICIAREEPANSYYYVSMRDIPPERTPRIIEIGYHPKTERFVTFSIQGTTREENVDEIARSLVEDVVRLHFRS